MSPTIESLYKKHYKELTGSKHLDEYSDKNIKRLFERVLQFLPNNGKLYKYRRGSNEGFEHAFDSLLNGYLWFANPSTLNDPDDATLNINQEC